MPDEDILVPDAQDAPDTSPDSGAAETPSAPPDPGASSPSADEVVQELRSRLAANGRELQATREANNHLATRLSTTEQHLERIGAKLTADEESNLRAYLDSLPADQRETEELRRKVGRLEARQAELDRAAASRPLTREEEEAETRQAAQRMALAASIEFGLEASEYIPWNDSRLGTEDWANPTAYVAAVRRLARKIALGQSSATPSSNSSQGGPSVAEAKKADSKTSFSSAEVQKIAEVAAAKAVADFSRELQTQVGGSPFSARPAAASGNPFADLVSDRKADPYQRSLDTYKPNDPKHGMRATRAALRENLDKAREAFEKRVG